MAGVLYTMVSYIQYVPMHSDTSVHVLQWTTLSKTVNMHYYSVVPRMEEVVVKHPNLEIVPPIRAKIVGEKHKLVFLVVVICYIPSGG